MANLQYHIQNRKDIILAAMSDAIDNKACKPVRLGEWECCKADDSLIALIEINALFLKKQFGYTKHDELMENIIFPVLKEKYPGLKFVYRQFVADQFRHLVWSYYAPR